MIKIGTKYKDMDFFFYVDEEEDGRDFWATPRQIGKLFGFRKPNKAIAKIISLHPESFKHCMKVRINDNGKAVEKTLFDFKDMLKFSKYSELPKSEVDARVDFLWEIFNEKDLDEMKEQVRNRRSQEENAPETEHEARCPQERISTPDNEGVVPLLKGIKHELTHVLYELGELKSQVKALKAENKACHTQCCELCPISCLVFKL